MKAPLDMQGWALSISLKYARDNAKKERMSEKETEHFIMLMRKAVESHNLMVPHADAIRDLIKRGRE